MRVWVIEWQFNDGTWEILQGVDPVDVPVFRTRKRAQEYIVQQCHNNIYMRVRKRWLVDSEPTGGDA